MIELSEVFSRVQNAERWPLVGGGHSLVEYVNRFVYVDGVLQKIPVMQPEFSKTITSEEKGNPTIIMKSMPPRIWG